MECYEILGIEPDSTQQDIKKAYFSMLRRYPPEKNSEMFQKIRQAYELLGNEEARRQYDQTFSMPEHLRGFYQKGQDYYHSGAYEKAIACLKEVLDSTDGLLFVNAFLGDCYLKNGNSGKAVKIYEKLVEADENNASYAGKLAKAYEERGYRLKAIAQYKKALELDGDNISLLIEMTRCLYNDGDTGGAFFNLKKAMSLADEKDIFIAELYETAIPLFLAFGEYDKAGACLTKINGYLEKEPNPSSGLLDSLYEIYMMLRYHNKNSKSRTKFDAYSLAAKLIAHISKDSMYYRPLAEELFTPVETDKKIDAMLHDMFLINMQGCDCDDCRKSLFHMHTNILAEIGKYRRMLLYAAREYPFFYDLDKDFYDMILDPDRRKDAFAYVRDLYKELITDIPDLLVVSGVDRTPEFEFFISNESRGDTFVRPTPKVSRNAPCPCGSGKKYKQCCGK